MKKTLAFLMASALSLFSHAFLCSATPTSAPGIIENKQTTAFEKFENKEKNYSIDYPSDWIKKDIPALDLVLFAKAKNAQETDVTPIRASMNVISEKVDAPVTLDQFFNESLTNLKSELKDVQVEDQGDITLGGIPAKWVFYSHVMEKMTFKVLQYFILAKDRVYLLTFSATVDDFNDFRSDFEKIATSFKLLNKAAQ